jgi:hypothetical protein
MKHYLKLISLTAFASALAFAQTADDKDFGNLIPEDHFSVTNAKTSLKENADISNYQIDVTPKKDSFVYKVNDVKTPRGHIFGKKKDFKLSVERAEGKVTRISSVSFTDNNKSGVHAVQTSTVQPDGFVNSNTNCYEDYKLGLFGTKKKSEGFKCVTVNKAVCEYFEKNQVDSALVDQINSCSDVLSKLSEHQLSLFKLSKDDQKKDVSALSKLNGKLSKTSNFYELEGKTLKSVSEIVLGYGSALSQCAFLKENNYLPATESNPEPQESSLYKNGTIGPSFNSGFNGIGY